MRINRRASLYGLALLTIVGMVGIAPAAGASTPQPAGITAPTKPIAKVVQQGTTDSCQQISAAKVAKLEAKAEARIGTTPATPPPLVAATPTSTCAGVPEPVNGVAPKVSVTFGWNVYLHLSPNDVDVMLWDADVGASWVTIAAVLCIAAGLVDPIAGAVCGVLAAWYTYWIPVILNEAHYDHDNSGVTFIALWGVWLPTGYSFP